jgi:glycosyltransferase involved in cell wall biosynthesis
MCTYNGEKYLAQQLDSLLNQTHSHLEIIITDDGSTDETINILNKYASNDSRIKVFQNEINLGFVQNFSKAISLCQGDFIALADQDDIWKPEKIELFLSKIEDHALIYSDAILMNEHGSPLNQQLIRPENNLLSGKPNKAFFFSNCVSGNTLMFKKNLIPYILPIPNVSYHDIWIAFVASSIGTINFTDEPLTYYRRHNEQITVHPTKTKNLNYFKNRLRLKKEEKINIAKTKLQDFTAYYHFANSIHDTETAELLKLFMEHYSKYESIFINFKLKQATLQYAHELFAITHQPKRIKRAKRAALGLKYYQSTFYAL